jgi:hypothetical protein
VETRRENAIPLVGVSAKHEESLLPGLRPLDRKKQSLSNLGSTFRASRTLQYQISYVNEVYDNHRLDQPPLEKLEWLAYCQKAKLAIEGICKRLLGRHHTQALALIFSRLNVFAPGAVVQVPADSVLYSGIEVMRGLP